MPMQHILSSSVALSSSHCSSTARLVASVPGRRFFSSSRSSNNSRSSSWNWSRVLVLSGTAIVCLSGVAVARDQGGFDDGIPHNPNAAADPSIPMMVPDALDELMISDEEDEDDSYSDPNLNTDEPEFIIPSSQAKLKVFAGSGNQLLATEVCALLGVQLGRTNIRKFADGEIGIQFLDNVRGKDVFVIQPICHPNIHDRLIELLLMVHALKRASAGRIFAVIPYYGYGRQLDFQSRNAAAMAAADVAVMLQSSGIDQVIAIDLHRNQIQGFFDNRVPVENLNPLKWAVPYFRDRSLENLVITSPSPLTVLRSKQFRQLLAHSDIKSRLALMFLRSHGGVTDGDVEHHHKVDKLQEFLQVVGSVAGSDVIIVDDMVDSGSRMCMAAEVLKKAGARRIFAFTTHGLFTGDAVDMLEESSITEVITFNTVPLPIDKTSRKIVQLSVAALLAESIRRINADESVAEMFMPTKRHSSK
jgi:ribose-phosphate pyrophosphokinase